MSDISLTEQESIHILEDIARNGENAAARIAALRQLELMRRDETEESQPELSDLDELGPRRQRRAQAKP